VIQQRQYEQHPHHQHQQHPKDATPTREGTEVATEAELMTETGESALLVQPGEHSRHRHHQHHRNTSDTTATVDATIGQHSSDTITAGADAITAGTDAITAGADHPQTHRKYHRDFQLVPPPQPDVPGPSKRAVANGNASSESDPLVKLRKLLGR
jgi:hypothetical protein